MSILVFVIFWGSLEGLAHTSFAEKNLLPPSYDGELWSFDREIAYLESHPEIDCIFMGSSMIRTMIDPSIVAQVYTASTGQPLHCFNFNINGMPIPVIARLSGFIQSRYEPRWLFIEISHQSFFLRRENETNAQVLENNWIDYLQGDFNLEGWLTEHSAAYRYIRTYQDWASPHYGERLSVFRGEQERVLSNGYYPVVIPKTNVRLPVAPEISNSEKNFIQSHRRFNVAKADWASLQAALVGQGNTHVIALEVPVSASYMGYYPNGREDWQLFIDAVRVYTDEAQVPFWTTNNKITIAEEFWHSRNHMLWLGGSQLSAWVGTQMALAEQQGFPSGDVPEPTLPLSPVESFLTTPLGLPANEVANYETFSQQMPDDLTIVNLSDENPRYFAYNIGRYITSIGREKDDFEFLWILEHAQTLPLDEADIVVMSEFWLQNQPSEWQAQFQDSAVYELDSRLEHPALPTAYLIYRVK